MTVATRPPTFLGLLGVLRPFTISPGTSGHVPNARDTALTRASREDYPRWLDHSASAQGCVRPIRLYGKIHTVDTATGEVTATRSTRTMPDGVIYTPCGDRRADVCPSCAELYRADTYHVIKSGLVGGKGVPESVTQHPAVFTTLTAPSFGPVHTRTTDASGAVKPCRRRRHATLCPHGRPTWCTQRHTDTARSLGKPLCPDCYDYAGHVVWNAHASELWRRTTITLRRLVGKLGKAHGVTLDISFGKVAEYQQRGIIHFHAIIRLDLIDDRDPTIVVPPPPDITAANLDELITHAAATTAFRTPAHPGNHATPANPDGWVITWGQQLVNRPLTRITGADITENQVAGYVAKYATKSTEATGFTARRITDDTIRHYADYHTHTGTLVAYCWDLGANPYDTGKPDGTGKPFHPDANRPITPQRHQFHITYGRLQRWAHMLGFGGHFTTRSRRYGPTRTALKNTRREYRRSQQLLHRATHHTQDHLDEDTTLIVGELTYAGIGWLSTGDAELAISAAAKAREHRQTARQERAIA